MIALYERAVSLYASLVNINAYHQPGVEAGKKAAASVLQLQTQVLNELKDTKSQISLTELTQKAGASNNIEVIYKILRHLHANKRNVLLEGDFSKPDSLLVSWQE